jgi:hypothetical protein
VQTKLTFSEINDGNPVLFLYHAGGGGEFISKTFAANHPDFHPLDFVMNERNQCHSIGPIHYASQWPDRDQPETWVNHRFKVTTPGLDYVSKDHPTAFNVAQYLKHMPRLMIIYMTATDHKEHFARLVFAKVARRIESPVTVDYIRSDVNDLLNPQEESELIAWSSQYPWVWSHELMIANTRLKDGRGLAKFDHEDSLDKYISDHVAQDHEYDRMIAEFQRSEYRIYTIGTDPLVTASRPFWQSLQLAFPKLDVAECVAATDEWIANNHRLLNTK